MNSKFDVCVVFDNIQLIVGGAISSGPGPCKLTVGGANTSKPGPCKYCIPKDSCGNNNQDCINYCVERGLPKDGATCENGLCCCYY
jgi:hypothetical protein